MNDESRILTVEYGSTAHGITEAGTGDHDELSVVIESAHQVLCTDGIGSKMQRDRPEGVRSQPGDTDRTFHSLRKFLSLALSGNPTILSVFWSSPVFTTPRGQELQNMGELFVGKHVIPKFQGYMRQQVDRMNGIRGSSGHGKRGGGRREELIERHGWDTKFAFHAARLGFQCIEIIETKRIQLPIQGQTAQWLSDLRNGRVPREDWQLQVDELDAQMSALRNTNKIPDGPSQEYVNDWSVKTHLQYWQSGEI